MKFETLYSKNINYFNKLSKLLSQNKLDHECMLSKATIQMYIKFDQLEDITKFKSWGSIIIKNTIKNEFRSLSIRPTVLINDIRNINLVDEETGIMDIKNDAKNQEQLLKDKQLYEQLRKNMNKLPRTQKHILEEYLTDMTHQEIAKKHSLNYETVKANYRHAVKTLQKFIVTGRI